jgi:anti-sigma B factor antagonist
MQIKERVVDGVTILDITGQITGDDGGDVMLREKVTGTVALGHVNLVLNLAASDYIDESGLAEIARLYSAIKSLGGKLKLLNAKGQVNNALTRTRLTTLLGLYTDEQEAIRSFSE